MNQLMRCRCGRWTTYGLACTSCRSSIPFSSDEETFEPVPPEEDANEPEENQLDEEEE